MNPYFLKAQKFGIKINYNLKTKSNKNLPY